MTFIARKSKIAALSLQVIVTEKKLPVEHFFIFFCVLECLPWWWLGYPNIKKSADFSKNIELGKKWRYICALGMFLLLRILNSILGILFSWRPGTREECYQASNT